MPQATAVYATKSTREVAGMVDKIVNRIEGGAQHGEIFDSVKNEPSFTPPAAAQKLLGMLDDKSASRIFDAVSEGITIYKEAHGVYPTADVVEAALQQGHSAMVFRGPGVAALDSANSLRHDAGSMQPNRAVVSVLAGIAEAIPFASYLPVDIGSNEAKLIIATHIAGSTYGDYANGGIMDGIDLGGAYTSALRFVKFNTGAFPANAKFTTTSLSTDPGYCDPAGTGVPVIRGRTIISINGLVVATDSLTSSGATSSFSSSIKLPGQSVTLTVTGFVTVLTGDIQITSITGGSLPAGAVVTAEAVIDYETSPGLIPSVLLDAKQYTLYANASRVMTQVGMDSLGQFQNELGLDPRSEALLAIRNQSGAERHFMALRMAYNLALNNVVPYNFDFTNQSLQKVRAQIWQDAQPIMGDADQKMANATMDHGITHLYAPEFVVNQWQSLGRDLFEPSGLSARAGVYRVGRLFGKYECYYSPKVVSQGADRKTAKVLAVGRSSQVARCPIVLGDAVSQTFLDLNMQSDLKQSNAMYSRDFTKVNPHQPSALGCALIDISNLS
jgi:hypothetical protein